MEEHEMQKQPSSAEAGGEDCSEGIGASTEEPDQRGQDQLRQRLLRNERIRMLIISIDLLALLVGALLDLMAGTVLPLFTAMVVAYLGYRGIDAWLDKHGPPGY